MSDYENCLNRICVRRAPQIDNGNLWCPVQRDHVLFDRIANAVIIEDLTNIGELGNRHHDIGPGSP
ncbi:MAG: hypothetical protein ACLQIJ_14530, partial [Polyangia bacterium]